MPKVDPESRQPMSDAPDQADPNLRGGKNIDDPAVEAQGTETGGSKTSEKVRGNVKETPAGDLDR